VSDPSADLLAVLAEANRRKLLGLLAEGEKSVTELVDRFEVTRSAISQHLGILADAGLVTARKEGRHRYYRLDPAGMAALRAALDSFWTAELDRVVIEARRRGVAGGPFGREESREERREQDGS
jgi:DNA-binding transcriptional ArsR family regulator